MPAGAVTAPGWFGKLSMLGDFAQRRLAPGLVRRLDAWLAGWIAESRHELGEDRWRKGYLDAPLLRFAWTAGVVGPTGWCGVLMPSCDNAGRYFPLLIVAPCTDAASDAGQRREWFDPVAAAATATLDDGASVEAFEDALAAAAWPADVLADPRAVPGTSHWWVEDGTEVTTLIGLPDAAALTSLMRLGASLPPS